MGTFRLRLREYLDERGISVYALIQASGLAPNTAYAIARGSSWNARLDTVAAIVTGLRRLTGEDVTLSDIMVHESTPDPSKMRAAPEKPESGPSPDDREWLEAFFAAAKGRSTEKNAPHYDQGSVVLVRFDQQQLRPCVTLTRADTARKSQVCGIVPLVPPLASRIEGLTPSFDKREGGLPARSTVMCTQVQTVEPAQVVGFIGQLDSRQLKHIKNALEQLFSLDRAADGRYAKR